MALSYGNLRLVDGFWEISDLPPHVCMKFKDVFTKISRTARLPYRVVNSPSNCADLEWFMSRYPLQMMPGDADALVGGRKTQQLSFAMINEIMTPEWKPPETIGFRPGCELRHYQEQAVHLVRTRQSLLLGDDLGLGKTWVGCGFMLQPGTLPCAVVTPVHLQSQWARVIRAVTTLRVHEIKTTRPYDLPPADVYLFRYSQLRGWFDTFRNCFFKSVIWEEAHELRTGEKSEKGKAAAELARSVGWRLGLTATPVQGYGEEVYEVIRFIDPDILGPKDEFTREWMPLDDEKAKGLGSFLRDQGAYLRRTKADVGQEMPPVSKIVEVVDWDEKTLANIDAFARQLAIKATQGSFVERGQASRDLDIMVRQATGISKAKAVAMFTRMLIESGQRVLLVGWHRACYDIWLEELKDFNPSLYTGSESQGQKSASVDAFISGQSRVLIMSLRSGSGLDGLQHVCSTVVFGELDWQPGVHGQVIGRLDREGQTQPVNAFFLVAEDGSDPPMIELLGLKASQAQAITDPFGRIEATVSEEGRLKSLVDRYLATKGQTDLFGSMAA